MSKFSLFKFTRSRRSTQTSEEETSGKRQSFDSSSGTDDIYQELPSPTASLTPYSSIENLKNPIQQCNSAEDIIHSEPDGSSPDLPKENVSVGYLENYCDDSPKKTTTTSISESDLTLYDIPSPNIRPLSILSMHSEDGKQATMSTTSSFARQISLRRANLLGRKPPTISSSIEPLPIPALVPSDPVTTCGTELYDVPASNRPVAADAQPAIVMAPVVPEVGNQPTKIQRMAQYWQGKLNEGGFLAATSVQKSESDLVQSKEIKSVGRSFSRPAIHRPALTSLTESLSPRATETTLRPSQLINKITKELETINKGTDSSNNAIFPRGIKAYQSHPHVKKEPPPRPPAPVRTNPSPIAKVFTETASKVALQQKMEDIMNTSKFPSHNNNCDQYRARWAYVAQNSLELSINSGEIVKAVTKCGPSWLVETRNKKGLVPKEYLIPVTGTGNVSPSPFPTGQTVLSS